MRWRKPTPPIYHCYGYLVHQAQLSDHQRFRKETYSCASQQMAALPYSLYPPQATDWIGFILCGCTMT